MDAALSELLGHAGSRRAQAVRGWLRGNLPFLEAVTGWPHGTPGDDTFDPGAAAYDRFVAGLRALLAEDAGPPLLVAPPITGFTTPQPTAPLPVPPVHDEAAEHLLALAERFGRDAQVLHHLLGVPVWPQEPGSLWTTFHLTLLRLPEPSADHWRAQVPRPAVAAEPQWIEVPSLGDRQEVLIPAAPCWGVAGLRTSIEGALPPDLARSLRPGDRGAAWRYSVLAAQTLALVDLDPGLRDLVAGRQEGTPQQLEDGPARQMYRTELAARLRRFIDLHDQPGRERLIAARAVDEALCSVVHFPPAASGSWWDGLDKQCRKITFRVAEGVDGLTLFLPMGSFRAVAGLTEKNIKFSGGEHDKVLRCLRLRLEGVGQGGKGRVVYGSAVT